MVHRTRRMAGCEKEIQQASPEQIRRINGIEGDNARYVQARYGRPVDQ